MKKIAIFDKLFSMFHNYLFEVEKSGCFDYTI